MTIAYNSSGVATTITDELGRQATLTWSNGLISQVAFPDGTIAAYTYTAITTAAGVPGSVLTSVARSVSGTTRTVTYKYEDTNLPNALTGIVDELGIRYATWAWDDTAGRVTSSQHAGGADLTTFSYNDAASTRTVTNPLGKQATYQFSQLPNSGGLALTAVNGLASTHCPATSTAMAYNSSTGYEASRTDENGNQITYVRDSQGRETSRIEAAGTSTARTIATTWGSAAPLPANTADATQSTAFTYDANGDVLTKTVTDLTNFTSPYSTNGRTRTWTYTYTSAGLLATATGPISGSTTTYTYNASGYLSSVADALGHTTHVTTLNGRGEPTTIVDPNGVTSTLAYDMDGVLSGITVNPGSSQSAYGFVYDAVGDLTKVTLPLGGYVQYTYDNARRVTQTVDNRGEKITYTRDAAGDVTAEKVYDGTGAQYMTHTNTFDELTRLLTSVGANSETTTYGYDPVGNPTKVTDGRGNLFSTAFDPLNRMLSQTDPESHSVTYGLNAADNLTKLTDGNGFQTTREVDGFGETIREISPDRGTRSYWYDAAGNVTKWIDGDSEETDLTYDLTNRLLTMTYPGASYETVTYTYDGVASGNKGVGHLTNVADETGSTAFVYDAQGRVTQSTAAIQSRSYLVSYGYDTNGKVTQMTLPSGRIVSIARATDGLVTGVTTKPSSTGTSQTIASSVVYRPFGPLATLTYGNGLALQKIYGQNYWLIGLKVTGASASTLDLTVNRDNAGTINNITDNASTGRGANYGVTTSGRLQWAIGPWNEFDYSYDGAGNMKERDKVVGGVKTYGINVGPGTNNQITQTQDASGNVLRTLGYRYGGDLYQDQRSGGQTYAYNYNARKRLVDIKLNGTDVGNYGYNAFGWRVWRKVFSPSTVQTHYVFDLKGRLLAEHNGATGAVVKEYIWIDDMPVAVIDSSSGTATTYFIHPGPVGEPLVLTNSAKAIVWNAYMEPYGAATLFGTASAAIDLRLPGQWLEAEGGNLNQNWYREYDPSLGRYIEADPLGIDAGQNLYTYVDGDPVNQIDPEGRSIWNSWRDRLIACYMVFCWDQDPRQPPPPPPPITRAGPKTCPPNKPPEHPKFSPLAPPPLHLPTWWPLLFLPLLAGVPA